MQSLIIAILMIFSTITIYMVMASVYNRYSYPVFIPVLTSTIIIVALLAGLHVPYKEYMTGGKWIHFLLGPAVTALAYPLYTQREVLKKYSLPVLGGVFTGLITGMITGMLFAMLLGMNHELILSLIPKSITTPVAMQIADGIGGIPSMTVIFVTLAGFSGVLLGPSIIKWVRIRSSLGRGIALGSASHGLGTSKASEYGEVSVSMSSVSMTLCALLGSVFGPVIVWLFHI